MLYWVTSGEFLGTTYGTNVYDKYKLSYTKTASISYRYSRGSWVETVTSTNINAYPANGVEYSYPDGYLWYIRR